MRILVLNQYFHPDRSATAHLLTELCEDLAERHGAEVTVVTGRPSYNPTEPVRAHGLIWQDRHGQVLVRRSWSSAFGRRSMAGRLSNYATYLTGSAIGAASASRPDIVLAWTDPPPVGVIAAVTARLRRVPFVLGTQDIFPDVAIRLGRLKNRAAVFGLRRMQRSLFQSASRIVSLGRDMNQRLLELGVPEAKIRTIPNWMDGSLVRPLQAPSAMRTAWGLDERFVVMHSGNVGLAQDLDTVLNAADRLRNQAEILFVIVGDGASRERLEREAEARRLPNVRFHPYQPKSALAEALGAADVLLVSLKRGLAGYIVPSKVYGYMAAGRPFIAAVERGSEPGLLAEEHACGIRIEPDDPAALADAVLRMRHAPLEEMGRRGRQAFEEHYERRIATAAYHTVLQEAVEERVRALRP